MKTFSVTQLKNGNLHVRIVEDGKVKVDRAYESTDFRSVVSLMLLTFPHDHPR
jgi:hypothetical protein